MATSPRAQYNPRKDQVHIDELLCDAQDLTNLSDWEDEFIEDLMSYKSRDKLWDLTESQYKKLVEISEKEDDFQVW